MTVQFTTTDLLNNQVLVEGTDRAGNTGQVILDGSQRAELRHDSALEGTLRNYDRALEEFFAPLTDAADRAAEQHRVLHEADPLTYVVEQEAVTAARGQQEVRLELDADTVILRAVEEAPERLLWVAGGTNLVVTAGPATISGGEDGPLIPDALVNALAEAGYEIVTE